MKNDKYIHRSRLRRGGTCSIKTSIETTLTRKECTSSLLLDYSHSASALEFVGFSTVLGGAGGGFFRRKRLLHGGGRVGGLVHVGRSVRGLLHRGLEHGLGSEACLRDCGSSDADWSRWDGAASHARGGGGQHWLHWLLVVVVDDAVGGRGDVVVVGGAAAVVCVGSAGGRRAGGSLNLVLGRRELGNVIVVLIGRA